MTNEQLPVYHQHRERSLSAVAPRGNPHNRATSGHWSLVTASN
ncbi:MAG: hypothetical protein ACFB4I_12310 [Cyanophyceae cyanobacterium]